MKRKNKERKRRERFTRKARRHAELEKTPKEKHWFDSSTDSSEESEKDQAYDSDLSSEYDDGPAHGFYNKISNMNWKKELTAKKIRLLREAKRYDRMMNHLMREVQRLDALVRLLLQRNNNMNQDLEIKRQKAAKNNKNEHQTAKPVRTNIGMQTEEIKKVDMAAQVTEKESMRLSSTQTNSKSLRIVDSEGINASQNSMSSSDENNSMLLRTTERESDLSQRNMLSSEENYSVFLRIIENEINNYAYHGQILMLNPVEEQAKNNKSDIEQDEQRRIRTESKITQTDPVQPEKHKITTLCWPGLPQLPSNPLSVIVSLLIVMMTALYFC